MQSQAPAPSRDTGLPPGVAIAPLGARLVAWLVDSLVPAVVGVLLGLLAPGTTGGLRVVVSLVLVVAGLGWALLLLAMIGGRAATPGMRLVKVQLVGFYDGRPVGLARAFLRGLVFWALSITGIGLLLMLAFLLVHPRRQGWHDRLVEAVMIRARALAPSVRQTPAVAARPSAPAAPDTAPPAPAPVVPAPVEPGPPVRYDPVPSFAPQTERPAGPPAAPEPRWVATLDDGREIGLDALVLLGRNPQPQPGEEDAQLVKLADETRTVSKSHLAIGRDADGIYVVDRGSTNGSTVTDPSGVSSRLQASEPAYVDDGTIVSMGDHWLRIERFEA